MLRSLSIRDVVLIDHLDLAFDSRLNVLTGETGAGKSILLDALALAIGERADSALVRAGAERAVVAAEFALPPDTPARSLLAERGLPDEGDTLLLRREVGTDGRSRAFVNDAPVGVALLRELGGLLVAIHGQFEGQRLLSPATHRGLLDAYGGLGAEASKTAAAWTTVKPWAARVRK